MDWLYESNSLLEMLGAAEKIESDVVCSKIDITEGFQDWFHYF